MGQNTVSELYSFLHEWRMVDSIKDFGTQTNIARSIASLLMSGKTPLTERYIKRICSTFSFVNPDWLRSGEGDMFLGEVPIPEERVREYREDLPQDLMDSLEELSKSFEWEEMEALFESQGEELKKAYEIISNYYTILAKKEEQIIKLTEVNLSYKEKVRQLESLLARLRENETSD